MTSILIPFQKTIKIKYGSYTHFGILTVSKIIESSLINFRIYVPNRSCFYNFRIDQYKILDYLNKKDMNRIFGSVIQDYEDLTNFQLAELIFMNKEEYRKNPNYDLINYDLLSSEIKNLLWKNFVSLFRFK